MIRFFTEDIDFTLSSKSARKNWIKEIIQKEGFKCGDVNYILCTDEYLLEINRTFLDHDTYTDIITFDQSENKLEIAGDIYISIDRIRSNSENLKVSFPDELDRVMIHGILHLCGYGDKTPDEKKIMRKKEDACLSLRRN